ncbi:MAG: AAA family ATPase [Planctomycetes bacterium]|nr:AAA family ATPase [Planctomycetota bacterium]
MKILELRLAAFGPFTNRVLDLRGGRHGLHVIFGPNEAGKSSALRALHAVLYGIPGQTSDAFLHPYAELRVGARLRLSSGDEIEFCRRKALKGSLLGPGDTRLDDHALDRFLGGVGPEQFRMFWGIDHARLLEGGREILEGHGDLGATLFAAGSGVSRLGALRRKLDDEAAALFAPRGHNRAVNQAISHLRDLRSAQRDATVSADAWVSQDRAARDADEQVARLTQHEQGLSGQRARLERLKRVLPLLAEREEMRRRLADLGDVVLLAPDFPQRRQDAETALRTAQQKLEPAAEELREQEAMVANLGATPPLAAETQAVSDLHKNLGSHRKALSDRPRLVGQHSEQRALAQRLLHELRPDLDIGTAESLRVFVGRRPRIQKLAAERERLDERLESARRRRKDTQEQASALARAAASLPPECDPESLVSTIEEARRRGDAEAEREKLAQAAQRNAAQRAAAIEKLQLPASAIDKLDALCVPTGAAIARFERTAQELDAESRTARTEHQRLTKRTRELEARIETLRSKKAVPTAEDLAAARTRRDDAFGLLRDHWEKGRDVTAEVRELLGKGKLMDLYPSAVTAADELADRLRSEAGRVAELAQYLEERERLATEMEEADQGSQRRRKAVEELEAAWRDAWKPVLATPPQIHDARTWCEDFSRLREHSGVALEVRQELQQLDAWIEKQIASLRVAITALEPTLQPAGGLPMMLAAAEKLRQRIEQEERVRVEHARQTRDAEQAIRDAEAAVRDAEAGVQAWQSKWSEAIRGLFAGDVPLPEDALFALDGVEKILRALDEAAGYETRIWGIDRDAESFRADVRTLAERLGEMAATEGRSEDAWVEGLHQRLGAVLKEDERRRQALAQLERLRVDVAGYKDAVAAASRTLSALREEARCGVDGDLVVAEQRNADRRACQSELARLEKELVRGGDGASIADLETEATSADKDTIDVRLGQIGEELAEVEKDLSAARDARAGAQAELRQLRGRSAAGETAEEVQATLARLRDDVVRYARLRVASTLLARRIDDYRRKNQAPLLLRAGALFREMTLRSFERLEADVEEDRPILVGVRPAGTRVPSYGMSEGTRDQLFFALRLAAVEASCAGGEPMPFIVDDVLVQFDDDRGAAALRVLADVASRTQVVLFTHHRHVRAGAEALTAPAGVVVHEL